MLNLKVSKQTRSEASKNKIIIKRVSNKLNKLNKHINKLNKHINKLSKSK